MRPRSTHALIALVSLCGLAACQKHSNPPPSPATAADPQDPCLDAVTQQAHANQFGDPPDTAYAGGTPLFDEASGHSLTRWEYIERHHPELAAKCRRDR